MNWGSVPTKELFVYIPNSPYCLPFRRRHALTFVVGIPTISVSSAASRTEHILGSQLRHFALPLNYYGGNMVARWRIIDNK